MNRVRLQKMQSVLVVGALLLLGLTHPVLAMDGPQELVQKTTERMLAKLKQESAALKKDPRLIYGMVSDIVLPNFDFVKMARWALGKNWRKASKPQKKAFVKAFRTLMVRTYAVALLEYTDQKIKFLPLRDDPASKDVTVHTEIKQTSSRPVSINYSLHLKKKGWKVYDLSVDGVSLVTNYRTSFGTEIRRTSLDALIARLEKHNKKGAS